MKKTILPAILLILYACSFNEVKNNSQPVKTILAIFAHPDDETIISPVLTKYIRQGIEVHLIVATDGRHGVRPHFEVPAGEKLTEIRSEELKCAAQKIGINSVIQLDFEDGTLAKQENLPLLSNKIDSIFQQVNPDLVFTWGADGGYGHPDHRIISNISTEVFQKYTAHKKLLHFALPNNAISSIETPTTDLGKLLKISWKTTAHKHLNYYELVSPEDHSQAKLALNCHKSQFTKDEMADFYSILHQESDTVYFHKW